MFRKLCVSGYHVTDSLFLTLIILTLSGVLCSLPGVEENEDGSSGTINFKSPSLDDEDSHSMHMPKDLKCDGCVAISYLLENEFKKFESRKKAGKKKLTESEIFEAVEKICEGEFSDYGLKDVKGVKRLSGPGLDTKDVPGIMAGGGRWPQRLRQMCSYYVGETGEEELYEEFEAGEGLQKFLCEGSGVLGECSKKDKKKKTEL